MGCAAGGADRLRSRRHPQTRRNRETDRTEIVGVTVWYRCAEIRPLFAIGRRALHEAP